MARRSEGIPDLSTIGGRLWKLREDAEMYIIDLAVEIGCSRYTIRCWETNLHIPDTWVIIKYSEYFGVTTDWILKGTA